MAANSGAVSNVKERHAVVTGGARGIGRAISAKLYAEGAKLSVIARDQASLDDFIEQHPGSTGYSADVTVPDQVAAAFSNAVADHGAVEILVNNAGAAHSAPFGRTSLELWRQMLDVNLTGMFLCQQQVFTPMRKAKFGRIINVVSTAGLLGYAYVVAYCAAKHGAIGLTRALAKECARDGITVNAVCPGFTETDLLENSLTNIMETTGRSREEAEDSLKAVNPQHRFIQPEEIAATVIWLCSHEAQSVTGQSIAIAGGEVM